MTHSTKAILTVVDGKIVVEPKADFWSISGSLQSRVKLSDAQLNNALFSDRMHFVDAYLKAWSQEHEGTIFTFDKILAKK